MQPSPARADAPDAATWLPLPPTDSLPSVEELLDAGSASGAPPRELPVGARGPGRAAPHDETAWLPLPEVEDLPPIQELLDPAPMTGAAAPSALTGEPPTPRDIPAEPSPARAEPADARSWLPLPAVDELPDITELVDPERGAGVSPPARTRRHRLRAHLPRRHTVFRLFVFVLVVVSLTGAYYFGSQALDQGDDVEMRVDGRVIDTETGVRSVASALAEQKIKLDDYDRVIPSGSTPISDGMTVRVLRAFPVNADVDGSPRTLYTTFRTPAGFLGDAAKQLGVAPAKLALRNPPSSVHRDSSVLVRTKRVGTLLVDGSAVNYNSPSDTIGELLEQYKVVLGPQDFMRLGRAGEGVALDTELPDNESVEVVRVAGTTDRVLEPYNLPDERRPDPNLEVGKTRVQQARVGTRWVTYSLELHDGREVGRSAISAVPAKVARPHIDFYGTKYNPIWDKMAQCETGGDWKHPGPEWQGGLGIYFQNWDHYGGRAFAPTADQATKYEQIIVAERIRAEHGWYAWGCAPRIGL